MSLYNGQNFEKVGIQRQAFLGVYARCDMGVKMFKRFLIILLCVGMIAGTVDAQSATFSGFLNNPGNAALMGSDLGPPLFGNDFEIANNVALYVISLSEPRTVMFVSKGFAAGGADPYLTLFQGTGNSATFLGSNYTQAFSTGGDFNLSFPLTPGNYTVAMSAFANMSFAENLGTGTLGDGFIGLGEPDTLGTYYYELEIGLPSVASTDIPTLTQFGFIFLAAIFGVNSVYYLRKRRYRHE
jgi:hypothetical protein